MSDKYDFEQHLSPYHHRIPPGSSASAVRLPKFTMPGKLLCREVPPSRGVQEGYNFL